MLLRTKRGTGGEQGPWCTPSPQSPPHCTSFKMACCWAAFWGKNEREIVKLSLSWLGRSGPGAGRASPRQDTATLLLPCGGTELSTPASIPSAGTGMFLPSFRLEAEELR